MTTRNRRREANGSFAMGVMTGALLGAGVALLFAPKSGAQLRDAIAGAAEALRDHVTELVGDVAAQAGDHLDRIEATVASAAETAKSAARAAGAPPLARSPFGVQS